MRSKRLLICDLEKKVTVWTWSCLSELFFTNLKETTYWNILLLRLVLTWLWGSWRWWWYQEHWHQLYWLLQPWHWRHERGLQDQVQEKLLGLLASQNKVSNIKSVFLSLWSRYFSHRRGCPRVLKLCMGSKLTKKIRFQSKTNWGTPLPPRCKFWVGKGDISRRGCFTVLKNWNSSWEWPSN